MICNNFIVLVEIVDNLLCIIFGIVFIIVGMIIVVYVLVVVVEKKWI